MKLIIISDTHNQHHDLKIPFGQVLIHCGDFTSLGKWDKVTKFLEWFDEQPHPHKILICGNHEVEPEKAHTHFEAMLEGYPGITYLYNSSTTIEGVKFWGSPYTPKFYDWAFMKDPERMHLVWDCIPEDTNVLITHGPPYGIGDVNGRGFHCGDKALLKRVKELSLSLHCFGHIHQSDKEDAKFTATSFGTFVNASTCTEGYKPKNRPIEVEIYPINT